MVMCVVVLLFGCPNHAFVNMYARFPSGSAGLTGDIIINENGDREADYTLNDMDPETGFMIPIATYFGAKKTYERLKGYEITWSGGRTEAPPDIPKCGFLNDAPECREPGMSCEIVIESERKRDSRKRLLHRKALALHLLFDLFLLLSQLHQRVFRSPSSL